MNTRFTETFLFEIVTIILLYILHLIFCKSLTEFRAFFSTLKSSGLGDIGLWCARKRFFKIVTDLTFVIPGSSHFGAISVEDADIGFDKFDSAHFNGFKVNQRNTPLWLHFSKSFYFNFFCIDFFFKQTKTASQLTDRISLYEVVLVICLFNPEYDEVYRVQMLRVGTVIGHRHCVVYIVCTVHNYRLYTKRPRIYTHVN